MLYWYALLQSTTRLLIRFVCFGALLLGGAGGVIASDSPPCPEYRHATKSPWINCFGTCTCASGNKYVGEFKGDKFNGQGTFTWADGSRDVGEFKDGELNGYAIRYFFVGSILKEGI